ncbi:MAG: site-2 protease family protein, partial [Acidobacteria bacterium]|nr:site-2 protease family protein [Acidobacteriota bacterium]
VNPLAWRNKRIANFWVSIAGILGNFAIAVVVGVIIRVLYTSGALVIRGGLAAADPNSTVMEGVASLLGTFFMLNVGLGVFNLFPIPPLDGSKILASILPESFESGLAALDQFGFILLFIALFTGVFGKIFGVIIPFAWGLVFIGA